MLTFFFHLFVYNFIIKREGGEKKFKFKFLSIPFAIKGIRVKYSKKSFIFKMNQN